MLHKKQNTNIRFGYLIYGISQEFSEESGKLGYPNFLYIDQGLGYSKCDKRWAPNVRGMGYPKCDKGCISGKCGEGALLCHNDFTNNNSPLWVNY